MFSFFKKKEKKIIIYFQGGLGNQLFQFATAFAIKDATNRIIYYDITSYKKNIGDKRDFHLEELLITNNIKPYNSFQIHFWIIKLLYKFHYNKSTSVSIFFNYIFETNPIHHNFNNFNFRWLNYKFPKSFNALYIYGFWMNESYFLNSKISIIKIINGFFNEKYNTIITKDLSFGIHVRFFKMSDTRLKNSTNQLENTTYYINAIRYFIEVVGAKNIYIYSHDIEKAKSLLNSYNLDILNFIFVKKTNDLECFYELSNIQYLIISNSSYSWWAAYLHSYFIPYNFTIAPKESEMLPYIPKEWLILN